MVLWQNYQDSRELDELGKVTKTVVKEAGDTLLLFRLKVDKKYGTSLCPSGSGSWVRDASKKMLWLKEKEDVVELRQKLQLASETLTLLILSAMG